MSGGFEEAHRLWIASHAGRRNGERRRRLEEGHLFLEKAFLEKVWWPAFGTLEDLHPEYEVRDYNDGRRFLDFAYQPFGARLALEADGYFPHIRDVDRWEYADNTLRDAHLVADGWTVLHFSSDIIKYRSRQAQQLLRQIVWGRGGQGMSSCLSPEERETLRFVKRKGAAATPKEVAAFLGRSRNTAGKLLRGLASRKLLRAANPDAKLVRSYEMTQVGRDLRL
ncbi:DNA-binding response regulator [Paenibacillus sp.]|uniref:DNA-binding response regulator n=1 Tax=Paenibacillus sp. TaxID=58172 RepID=UPI002D47D31E|nr:DNA-binding response regulator [Paenibacillus sp.]HZG88063.1 DNA-binding response regulator [Paenibacillus sp.]